MQVLAVTPDGTGWRPPGRLPTPEAASYWKDAITLLLLVIALPWLVVNIIKRPARVLAGRGATGAAS